MYYFEWDEEKAASNFKKHGIRFEEAVAVFADPNHLMRQDRIENGEYRWQTLGMIRGQLILLVAHTVIEQSEQVGIRLISARKADKQERKQYDNHQI